MKTLKILFLIDSLGGGGSERSLFELLPFLAKANISFFVVCLKKLEEGLQNEVQKRGFEVHFMNGKGLMTRVRELRQLVKAENPDLIHTSLFESNMVGRIARIDVPVLCSLVNTPYEAVRFQDPNIKARRFRMVKRIDSWTARHCVTHFHAVSQAAKDSAVATLGIPSERITVVERGRDPDRLGNPSKDRFHRARLALGLKETDEVIVNVGRHEYQKGQTYLLEAMAELFPRHPKLVLLIAGKQGTLSNQLSQRCASLGVNGIVRFLGHRVDVPEILASADLFAFPSLFEGMPGAVIEAMALGLPVVAFDIPALREVVEPNHNALLVPPASFIELAHAISELLNDRSKCATFGKRSREIFEERFTLDRSAAGMIELYFQVASMRK